MTGEIERCVSDRGRAAGWMADRGGIAPVDKRVASVGAGRAGLACAGVLGRRGVRVTVYDRHPEIGGRAERMMAEVGGTVARDPATGVRTVNREVTVSLVLSRCNVLADGRRRWEVRFDTSLTPDSTVAVRLDETNQAALDYYLLPRLDFGQPRIHLADHNSIEFESYRFDSLDYLYGMAERSRLRRVA